MGSGRAALVLALAAIASAGLVALVSRTPASIRMDRPGPEATSPELGARFTPEQIDRHGRYRGPAYLSLALSTALGLATLLFAAKTFLPRAIPSFERVPGGWPVTVVLATAFLVAVGAVVQLPLSYVRGFAMEHAWGLSTQDIGGWLSDQGRGVLVTIVTTAIGALAFFAIVRAFPRTWWLWGWVVFTAFTILFTLLWPIVIAPLFNRFTPLEDESLRSRIVALAQDAGVSIDDVLVADASRRTTAENAYVAGIGTSKRMVLYDNLLAAGDEDETSFVVAHELGHEVQHHIWKFVALASGGLLAAFVALALIAHSGVWSWAEASGIRDVRALPLLMLFVMAAGLVSMPVQNSVSRAFERQADEVALRLTHDPDTAIEVFRRLAFANLADLRPPRPVVWALFSHPPISDRLRDVEAVAGKLPTP